MPPLITLRGPSASGKTSTAYALRQRMLDGGVSQVVVIEQDYVRRKIWKEKDWHPNHREMIVRMVRLALEKNIPVILEGILHSKHYTEMFEEILSYHSAPRHSFYFDISFEETLRRHQFKPQAQEYGEEKMRDWYHSEDYISILDEVRIGEELKGEEIVERIMNVMV